MKIYLAGEREGSLSDTVNIWTHARRRLFSYYYHGFQTGKPSVHVEKARHLDLFLDSGAFTAFTKKQNIPLEQFAEFIKATRDWWTVCSNIDVIGQGEAAAAASWKNMEALHKLGADVIPVFHVREPDSWLARMTDYPYIAIGGMVPESTSWLKPRLDQLWADVLTNKDGTAKTKVHGFGLTTQTLMFRYPWHSVDSTSWLMTGVYGACLFRRPGTKTLVKVVFSEQSPEARKINGWHWWSWRMTPGDPRLQEVEKLLEPFGVTAEQCATHYAYRDIINAATFQDMEDLGIDEFHPKQPTLFSAV